jgi:protein involved in polysaccharide export with SLBB domain
MLRRWACAAALSLLVVMLALTAPAARAQVGMTNTAANAQAAPAMGAAPMAAAPAASPTVSHDAAVRGTAPAYTLGSGDRLRVTVFGEQDLSGEFEVSSTGKIAMPLIGEVNVAGLTLAQVSGNIGEKLTNGYLRDPKVNIDVMNYRPFFILGEVIKPGSYPFVNGMTVVNAVAVAGGYTYRADKDDITIVRAADAQKTEKKITETDMVYPGDVVRIPERFF